MVTAFRVPLVLVAFALAASLPRLAGACPPVATPYWTLTDALPAVRTGLARDGGVVIRGKPWSPPGGPTEFADVLLFDEGGNRIPAVWVTWYSAEPSLAFRPIVPLPARARFTLRAAVSNAAMRPAEAAGPEAASFTFETGDDLARPLTLAGPLRVRLEAFNQDGIKCDLITTCGVNPSSCRNLGTRRALRARITVPAATGGVDFDGYRGWLHFGDVAPATFGAAGDNPRKAPEGNINGADWLEVRPGMETERLVGVFDQEAPYVPCFALSIWDLAGQNVQPTPVCFPAMTPSEYARELDRASERGPEPAAETSGGCTAVPGGAGGPWPLAIALATAWISRRRAGKSPPRRVRPNSSRQSVSSGVR